MWSADGADAYCASPVSVPTGTLPDDWYQGTTAFTDRLWKIDFTARAATQVADLPTLISTPVDAVSLTVDQGETELVFMNKSDDSLWAYSL